jgi:nucleoside phosphorylase/Tfp pilus assembly protein PilF
LTVTSENADIQEQNPHCDVLLVTVTQVEAQAVLTFLQEDLGHKLERLFIGDKTYYDLGVIGGARIFLVQSEMGSGGPSGSLLTVTEGIRVLSPSAVVMVGIAFGIDPQRQRIGEILVSRQLSGYELQRVSNGSSGQLVINPRGDRPQASTRLLDRFRSGHLDWRGPAVHFGLVLSGEKLVDHQSFRDQLRTLEPEAIGGEMEGAGLYAAAQRAKVDWILVKAICDWADGNKHQHKRQRQQRAAKNAARFTLHILRQGGLVADKSDHPDPSLLKRGPQVHSAVPIWTVPYERNPFFTGRESVLIELHDALKRDSLAALNQGQAISGLGGIGKTQTAVEYCYRYRDEYSTIFWIGADTEEVLQASFVEIARLLGLPEKDAHHPEDAIQAVRKWLENQSNWLLIFDNADTPELLKAFRPRNPKGHILLTSRAQVFDALGISRPIEMRVMLPEEAVMFLFKRTGRDDKNPIERKAAADLAAELGYLPLALEQASAYITQKTTRFQDYLASYGRQRLNVLNKSLPKAGDYPESVATTWLLNFREVEKTPEAADILRMSAFLSPDAIPLELIADGAAHLGPVLSSTLATAHDNPLLLHEALESLTRYSLIRRDIDTHTYSMHRLVQEVVKDKMDVATQRLWAERVVRAINHIFPAVNVATWPRCHRYLPHALVCATLIEQEQMVFPEAARLLSQAGEFLYERGQYSATERLLQQALTIQEQVLGAEHPDTLTILDNLAAVYNKLDKYEQAVLLLQRALAIQEQVLGAEHPDVATSLNSLAAVYNNQGNYKQAEPLLWRALAIRERVLGADHPHTALTLSNLGFNQRKQDKYEEAEPLYKRALAIRERVLGVDHPDTGLICNNLAVLYMNQSKYEQAEPYLRRALSITEQAFGPSHLKTAYVLQVYADLLRMMQRTEKATILEWRAKAIRTKQS